MLQSWSKLSFALVHSSEQMMTEETKWKDGYLKEIKKNHTRMYLKNILLFI